MDGTRRLLRVFAESVEISTICGAIVAGLSRCGKQHDSGLGGVRTKLRRLW